MAATASTHSNGLHPGDLLLGRSVDGHGWLIRGLDRSAYSHAGLYDGERVIVCGPFGIERRPPYPADVFRFHHDGRPLDTAGLEASAVLSQAGAYLTRGAQHRCTPAYLLGLLLIMRRAGHSAWQRALIEASGDLLVAGTRRSIHRHFPVGAAALTGAELVSMLFRSAAQHTGRPYEILVAPEARHPRPAWPPTSGRFERVIQDLEELLARANPELPIAISRARSTAPDSSAAVAAGGPLAPACLMTAGDLQHSPSFVRVGRCPLPV